MKVYIRKRYSKRNLRSKSPATYTARQERIGADVHATIKLAPVLKKHPDLRKAIVAHETNEIKRWGQGHTDSHRYASKKEPKLTRNLGGVSGFWREIDRRNRI